MKTVFERIYDIFDKNINEEENYDIKNKILKIKEDIEKLEILLYKDTKINYDTLFNEIDNAFKWDSLILNQIKPVLKHFIFGVSKYIKIKK